MTSLKRNLSLLSIGALLGAALAYYLAPVVEKTKIEIEEKEVVKRDVVTVIKEVVRSDGTKETTTTTTDKTKEKRQTEIEKLVQVPVEKNWRVSASTDLSSPATSAVYRLSVERRILGPIFVGATGSTRNEFGISVGLEF